MTSLSSTLGCLKRQLRRSDSIFKALRGNSRIRLVYFCYIYFRHVCKDMLLGALKISGRYIHRARCTYPYLRTNVLADAPLGSFMNLFSIGLTLWREYYNLMKSLTDPFMEQLCEKLCRACTIRQHLLLRHTFHMMLSRSRGDIF